MSQSLRNLSEASDEFVAAIQWYEKQRPGLGADFYDAVIEATSLIEAQPELGVFDPDTRTRRVMVHRFPYQLVYVVTEEETVIVAVAHSRRQPGYWKGRME